MDPVTRLDGTSMMTEEPTNATAGGALSGSLPGSDTGPGTTSTAGLGTIPDTATPGLSTIPGTTSTAGLGTLPGTATPGLGTIPGTTSHPGLANFEAFAMQQTIIADIKFFCETTNFGDDTGTPEDPNAGDMDTSGMGTLNPAALEAEEKTKTVLFSVDALKLVDVLSTPITEPAGFLDMVRRSLPIGVELTPKKLLAAIHPDRFVRQNEDVKEKAQEAFSRVQQYLKWQKPELFQGSFQGVKDTDLMNVEILEDYHDKAYRTATPHLIKLFEAFQRGEEVKLQYNTDVQLSDTVKAAHASLKKINEDLQRKNKEGNNPKFCGIIGVAAFTGGWQVAKEKNDDAPLYEMCEVNRYPSGWRFQPPRDDYSYDYYRETEIIDEFKPTLKLFYDNLPDGKEEYTQEALKEIAGEILRIKGLFEEELATENKRHNLPAKLHTAPLEKILPIYCGLKKFRSVGREDCVQALEEELYQELAKQKVSLKWSPFYQTGWEGCENLHHPDSQNTSNTTQTNASASTQNTLTQTKVLSNGKAVLSIPMRSVKHTSRPGYTNGGDQIIAIQRAGSHSASFVVDTNGSRRIMSYGSAGGKLVRESAINAGVPFTTTDAEGLKGMIQESGGYEITYVAVGEWDTYKRTVKGNPQLPLVIIGIRFSKPEFGERHVSRSTLGLTIGASAAQHEISHAMGGDGDEDILSTLIGKMDISDIPHLVQWRDQHNPRLLTYPGPMMTFNTPVPPTSWQSMQSPYQFPPQQGFQGSKGFQQGYQQPQPGFQGFSGFQQPQSGFQGFSGFQQPQSGFQGFPGYQQPQPGLKGSQQATELLKGWSDLSKYLMGPKADLADFSNILKTKVPAIIQYLKQTEDGVRQLDKKRFQQFQYYNNKDKLKEVIQGWSQNIQSAPSSREVGYVLDELYHYAERLGDIQGNTGY